jgi:pSer/pThr/pTyr-binding forkhead associated (FHA) protein
VVESGSTIELPKAPQVIIGRADPVSRFYPDVDLSPYNALQNGVGRRHVRMSVKNGIIVVEDMNSTNGTMINRQRLTPRMAQPINDCDELRIGTLTLRFYL